MTGSLLGLSTLPNDPKSTVYVSNSFGFPNAPSSGALQNLSEVGGEDETPDGPPAVEEGTDDLGTDDTNDETLSRIVASNEAQGAYQLEMMKVSPVSSRALQRSIALLTRR